MVKRHLAGLTVAALIVGGGATAWAATPDSSSTPTASGSPPAASGQPAKGGGRGGAMLQRRLVHGDLIVRGKGGTFENVTVDRGTVQSKGDNTITLARPDGKTVTVTVDGATKYRGVADFASVQTGQPATVLSKDGKAVGVAQPPPGGNNRPRGNVGA